MKRGPLYLAAALVEVLRFFVLMTFAAALGLLGQRPLLPALLRYVAVGQLLFFAAFVFLWVDEERYAVYRPLALTGKIVSFVALVPVALSFAGSETFASSGRQAMVTGIFLPLADLFGILVLGFYRRSKPALPPEPPDAAQHGPEDIEQVESLP